MPVLLNREGRIFLFMKRKIFVAVMLVFAGLAVLAVSAGTRPLEGLRAEEVQRVTVSRYPNLETELTAEETARLVPLLNALTVYRKDPTWRDYSGDPPVFTLDLTDGTTLVVFPYNPFVVINGTGYRADRKGMKNLSDFARAIELQAP